MYLLQGSALCGDVSAHYLNIVYAHCGISFNFLLFACLAPGMPAAIFLTATQALCSINLRAIQHRNSFA